MGYNLPAYIYTESPYWNDISAKGRLIWFIKKQVHCFLFRREGAVFFVQTDDVNERSRKFLHCDKVYYF